MKVPDNLLYSIFQQQDERIRREIARKTIEISTGRRIHNLSDDPPATFNVINLRQEISQLSQFSKNRLFADVNLTYADLTLEKMSNKVKWLYVKAVQAKNEIHTADSLRSLAVEFTEAIDFLLDRANEKLGENYIFSGSALTTKPFDSNFNYLGSSESFNVQIDEANFTEVFLPGNRVFDTNVYQLNTLFDNPSSNLGVSGTITVSYNTTTVTADYGRGIWYLTAKVTDPDVPLSSYGLDGDLVLYDSGMNEISRINNYGNISLNDLITQINTTFGGENITASLVNNPDGSYTLRVEDTDVPPNNFITDTGENILENNTLKNFVKIFNALSPPDLTAFMHQVPDGRYTLRLIPSEAETFINISFTGSALGDFYTLNIFQLLGEVKEKLKSAYSPDESDIMAIQRSYDIITSRRSEIGSILSQVKAQEKIQENKMDILRKQKSDNEDADLSESIMEYTRYRMAYDALMKIIADTRDMTILKYL